MTEPGPRPPAAAAEQPPTPGAAQLVGHGAARGAYATHAFDDRGATSTHTATLAGTWERRRDDGTWRTGMHVRPTRAT